MFESLEVSRVVVFIVEVAVLYAGGSYATGRLYGLSLGSGDSGGAAGWARWLFYLLVMPGTALHESAHYLACLLTGTGVARFSPFSPRTAPDGRIILGYVLHEERPAPITAVIGLAPVVLNPLGIVVATALLTPVTYHQAATFDLAAFSTGVLRSGFLLASPLQALLWAYLAFSFALGSVPSREDLRSVPAALVFCAGLILLVLFLQGPSVEVSAAGLYQAVSGFSAAASALYALPASVAAASALLVFVLAAGLARDRRG